MYDICGKWNGFNHMIFFNSSLYKINKLLLSVIFNIFLFGKLSKPQFIPNNWKIQQSCLFYSTHYHAKKKFTVHTFLIIMAIFAHPIDHVKNKHSIFAFNWSDKKISLSFSRHWTHQQLLITIIFWLKYILSLSHNDRDRFSL